MARLSTTAILNELAMYSELYLDIDEFLSESDMFIEGLDMEEGQYNKVIDRLKLDILDIEQFVEKNHCKCVSNPRAFSGSNIPSKDGLLSNDIFGFTMEERMGTFGYIDLHGWFLDPSCYKTWIRLDPKVRNIVHGTKYYIIDEKGDFVEDEENGDTGLTWLHNNINKIRFRPSTSRTKSISLKYLEQNRDKMFIKKYIVIPPFYRDKNSASSSRKVVGLGGINKIYNNLIVSTNALTATQEYGIDASDAMNGRVQEYILTIYDWFCGNTNKNLDKKDSGQGMSGKLGILRRTNTSKTANFSSRLVISAVDLKSADRPEELMVTYDKSAVPLYATITQFRDFVMYHTRQFFENEFTGSHTYPVVMKNGQTKVIVPDSPEITFSDERIKKEMDRFLHGYNNRFVPIEVPVEGTNEVYYMQFKGRGIDPNNRTSENPLTNRRLTWCDVFYMACVEAVKDKHILITRFPIDYFSNQFVTKVEVSSTKEMEQIEYNGEIYKWYPKIREEDIGKDTSNTFVDTLRFSNTYLVGIGGDYDGDQCTCKGVYTREANKELDELMNSKQNFITFGGSPLREPGADSMQALYALTKVLSTTNITKSNSIEYA